MADIMKIVILADGTIRTETDPVSGPNHQSAEEFLKTVHFLTGGEGVRIPKNPELINHHSHSHSHLEQRG